MSPSLRVVPATEDGRQLAENAARRDRIDALRIDRSRVPPASTLPPSPPEAAAAEQRIERCRARLEHVPKLELLRAWLRKHGGELPRQPIVRR